jgi:hypothetical protein
MTAPACPVPRFLTHRGFFLTSTCDVKSDDDVPKWDRNCHSQYLNDIFQDLLDGRGDNNESPAIGFTVKGFIGKHMCLTLQPFPSL